MKITVVAAIAPSATPMTTLEKSNEIATRCKAANNGELLWHWREGFEKVERHAILSVLRHTLQPDEHFYFADVFQTTPAGGLINGLNMMGFIEPTGNKRDCFILIDEHDDLYKRVGAKEWRWLLTPDTFDLMEQAFTEELSERFLPKKALHD